MERKFQCRRSLDDRPSLEKPMKIYSLLTLIVAAMSFALPTFAAGPSGK